MGLTKDEVLAVLKQQGVQFELFEHAPVMTCDAQVQALQGVNGQVTKNLFVRDKKRRQYVITALPDTKVDLKVLSARLGTGKGGLSWASEELMQQSLQVEPGCVTPLALANRDSCKHVLLLIDRKLQAPGTKFFVHPIVNSSSVLIDSAGLDAFVKGVGRQPIYVDLEADPKIDRDNPPDLKEFADSIEPPPKEDESSSSATTPGNPAAAGTAAAAAAPAAAAAKAAPAKAAGKKAAGGGKAAAGAAKPSNAEHHIQLTNVVNRTDDLIEMVARALLGKPASEAGTDPYVLRRLRADVQMQLTAFKNAAFTAGYTAGKDEVVAYATKRYA